MSTQEPGKDALLIEMLRAVADDLNPSDYVVVNGERIGVQATIHRALARVQELEAQVAMLTADPEAMAFRYIAAVNRGKQSEAKMQELEREVAELKKGKEPETADVYFNSERKEK